MASGGSWSSMGCSVRMSSPRGYAGLSGVRITGISPFHRRSLDHALGGARSSRLLLPLVLLGKAYPANDAPGVEVAGELVLIAVARHQYDDTPIVDVL